MPEIEIAQPFSCVTATAAANTAVSVVIPAAAATRVLYFVAASVSVADSGAVTLTVSDGATAVMKLDLILVAGTPYVLNLPTGLAGTPGNTMTVALSAPASTSVAKVTVGSDTL